MKCPVCTKRMMCLDSRNDGLVTRRRYGCGCGRKSSSAEITFASKMTPEESKCFNGIAQTISKLDVTQLGHLNSLLNAALALKQD